MDSHRIIKNPFDPALQEDFNKFVHDVGNLDRHEVDLPKISLLLSGASKIYSAQVESFVKDVEELLRLCTRTKLASIEEKKSKEVAPPDRESTTNESSQRANESADMDQVNGEVVEEEEEIPRQQDGDVDSGLGSAERSPESQTAENNGDLIAPEDDGNINIVVDTDTITLDGDDEILPEENTGEEGTILANPEGEELNPSSQEEDEIRAKAKKPRDGQWFPPSLNSPARAGTIDPNRLNSPSLVRLAKRKIYTEDNIPSAKRVKEDDYSEVDVAADFAGDGAEVEMEETLEPMMGFTLSQEFPSAAAASFPPEDQSIIQDCFNELYHLPLTFGLSKNDLSSAFSRTVDRMSDVFEKNNVPVTRHLVKEASVITSTTTLEMTNGLIPPVAHSLGDIYNTLVDTCRKKCETLIQNTSMSIMEQTKGKSFAESRADIKSMISELQRNIVPKFALVPLMAENTPEFFQHVVNFEKKIKKILEEEAKKDEFDVRKYERDVLEVTVTESSQLVANSQGFDGFLGPATQQSVDEVLFASQSTRSNFDGSQISNLTGSAWVPLKHIFKHMKSFDRTETARSIYAVLALLSYQNLDINYDQLYSHESAILSGVSKEDEIGSQFPRGVKICTSRCPDADKDEVLLAALTSESRDETFRQLLDDEVRNVEDAAASTSRGENNVASAGTLAARKYDEGRIDAGIAEAMADFVEEEGTVFTGRLFAKERKRKAAENATTPSSAPTTSATKSSATNPANE